MPLLASPPRNARKYGLLRYCHGEQGLDLVVFLTPEAAFAFDSAVSGIEETAASTAEARARITAFCKETSDVVLCDLCDHADRPSDRPAMILRSIYPHSQRRPPLWGEVDAS